MTSGLLLAIGILVGTAYDVVVFNPPNDHKWKLILFSTHTTLFCRHPFKVVATQQQDPRMPNSVLEVGAMWDNKQEITTPKQPVRPFMYVAHLNAHRMNKWQLVYWLHPGLCCLQYLR